MLPESIAGVTANEEVATAAAESQTTVSTDDFLQMLIAQLENQDPLEPQDPTEFTAQLATFSNLEQLVNINDGIDTLIDLSSPEPTDEDGETPVDATDTLLRSLTASSMIGREVVAAGDHFEVGADMDAADLRFSLAGPAAEVEVVIRDAAGSVVNTLQLGRADTGGIQETSFDLRSESGSRIADGVYQFEVRARNLPDTPVSSQTMVSGRVTGTGFGTDQPVLFLGEVAVPLSNVIEIQEPGS